MTDSASNTTEMPVSTEINRCLNTRVFRTMAVTTGLAVTVSTFITPWRASTGLLMGGLLALFSHSWLKNSAAAAINLSIDAGRSQIRLAQFVLRYVVIGSVVFAAYTLNVVALPAVLVGLCSFVVALFLEALREFYFAIIRREETD